MREHVNRSLSLLMTACMLLTLIPAAALPVKAANDGSGIAVDFSLAQKNKDLTPEAALLQAAQANATYKATDQAFYEQVKTKYPWKPINTWSVRNADTSGDKDLRVKLQSKDEADTYIVLDSDINKEYHNDYLWDPIKITKSKVLDLNGHTLKIRYDANRRSDDAETKYAQTTKPQFHNCHAFEINENATLTIIDSSAWRGGTDDGKGTGGISFTGRMIDPYEHAIKFYTTRDMFYVNNGNLLIYGGTFQAGRKKDMLKDSFSWDKLKTVIGSAVELGVNIAEYATGISVASATYQDVLQEQGNLAVFDEKGTTGDGDDGTDGTTQTTYDRDGVHYSPAEEEKEDTPTGEKSRNKTVDEKAGSGSNASNKDGTAKDDKNTKLAKAQKDVVDKAVNKSAIGKMVDGAFGLVDNIISLCQKDDRSRVTETVQGTVVRVGANGCFVAYGGTFKGYGSTPNTRNAVVEVVKLAKPKPKDSRKPDGGVAYIYDGTFEAYNGANVFNMVKMNAQPQTIWQTVEDQSGNKTEEKVQIGVNESGGVEVLYFDNQDELPTNQKDRDAFVAEPVDTGGVQVRGGTFRCFYDMMNVAIREDSDPDDDDHNFRKFPGTMGAVNLGVQSYGEDLIQDGRIQINDTYGAGALVLMDERSAEKKAAEAAGKTFDEGLYHYRLYCGDTELRAKTYLEVTPNTAEINASHSMQLATYFEGDSVARLWKNDKEKENIRAPLAQTETYFDYMFDDRDAANYSILPNFHHYMDQKGENVKMDVYGQNLDASELWYYATPLNAASAPIQEPAIGLTDGKEGSYKAWDHNAITTNLVYFTYKIYRVDPLTRENISETEEYGVDKPLYELRYGSSKDALKIKLNLKDAQAAMKSQGVKTRDGTAWQGFRQGEMYRVTLDMEEHMAQDFQGVSDFGKRFPVAKTSSSVIFRCVSYNETKEKDKKKDLDFTPLQWVGIPKVGERATINLVNAKAGLTDFEHDNKIFDVYYQWWETDKDGNPIRLLAGTDHIYDGDSVKERAKNKPSLWAPDSDDYTYVNTVDPNDPNRGSYTYSKGEKSHGLPGDKNGKTNAEILQKWTCNNLHMYAFETTPKSRLTLDGTDNLTPRNNDIFATNTDTCYIPADMSDKYLRVKAVVTNIRWPKNFDRKQTFWSHVYHLPYYLPDNYQHEWTGWDTVQVPEGQAGKAITPIDLKKYVTGGSGNYHFAIVSGPSWLRLGYEDGVLSGTRPKGAASPSNLRVQIVDSKFGMRVDTAILVDIKVGGAFDVLEGTVTITGTRRAGLGLLAEVDGVNANKNDLCYRWYSDDEFVGAAYQDGEMYHVLKYDIGRSIRCEVTDGSGRYAGTLTSEAVKILKESGPNAPSVVPHVYNKDGDVYADLECTGTHPLELSGTSDFKTVAQRAETGGFQKVPAGTWYVRSAETDYKEPGTAATITISDNDALTLLPADPVPLGFGGEDYEIPLQAMNGTPPYTFEIVEKDSTISAGVETISADDGTARLYGTFPTEYLYDKTLGKYINYSLGEQATVRVTDTKENVAETTYYFEGYDEKRDEPFIDVTSTTVIDANVGYSSLDPGATAVMTLRNRSSGQLDLSGLDVENVWIYDEPYYGGAGTTDITDYIQFIPDEEHQILDRFQEYTLTLRLRPGMTAQKTVAMYVKLSGVELESDSFTWFNGEKCLQPSLTIRPAALEDCILQAVGDVVADGTAQEPAIGVISPGGSALVQGKDFIVKYENNIKAGTADFTVTGAGKDWTGTLTGTFNIVKAGTSDKEMDYYAPAGVKDKQTLPLSALVPANSGGITGLTVENKDDPSGTAEGSTEKDNAGQALTFTPTGAAKEGDVLTYTVTVKTVNYEPYTAVLRVHFTEKPAPTLKIDPYQKTYDGQPVQVSDLKATATYDGKAVSGTWCFADLTDLRIIDTQSAAPVMVRFLPDDTAKFREGLTSVMVTIDKGEVTGSPTWNLAGKGKDYYHLYEYGLTTEDSSFSVPGRVEWDDPADTRLGIDEIDKEYGWTFYPEDQRNYEIKKGTIVPRSSKSRILGRVSGEQLSYALDMCGGIYAGAVVIAARYDNGRMTDVQQIEIYTTYSPRDDSDLRLTYTFDMKGSGDQYKLFVINPEGHQPACPAWSYQ